jgi:hypothetical protein
MAPSILQLAFGDHSIVIQKAHYTFWKRTHDGRCWLFRECERDARQITRVLFDGELIAGLWSTEAM